MTGIDPALARALDAAQPPPLSADFDARVLAAIDREGEAALPRMRGRALGTATGWRRSRNLALGLAAFSLVSAAAAATGILGDKARSLPVIATIAEKIDPRPRPKPHAIAKTHRAPAKVQAPAPLPDVPAAALPTAHLGDGELREAIRSRRKERRATVREALGLTPSGERLTPEERRRLRAMPVEDRRALAERLRALRQARSVEPGQADGPVPTGQPAAEPNEPAAAASASPAATPALQPGERLRRWREWRRARREALESQAP